MNEKGASTSPAVNRAVRTASIPFSSLPGQSRLFLDYLKDPVSLSRFYPNAAPDSAALCRYFDEVITAYSTDRRDLCNALAQANTEYGCADPTFSNLEKLSDPRAVAVVTGQQAGLFTGPLYTIYKALSAIRMAERLSDLGVKAVPVFWMATEDHDFDEISHAFVLGRDGRLLEAKISLAPQDRGRPVGDVVLAREAGECVRSFVEALPVTEFSAEVRALLSGEWSEGRPIGTAFAATLARLLSDRGLILLDPTTAPMKRLASSIYARAVKNAPVIVESLVKRSEELQAAGYHAQVLVEDDYFPLFWLTDDGLRSSIRKKEEGIYLSKEDKREFTLDDLTEIALHEPSRLSPGVMLRSVVQDHILPTICYLGGGAEIAYFAQNSESYRVLDRPVTPIMHRQSFTIVESKHARSLSAFGLELTDLFDGYEAIVPRVVEAGISPGLSRIFADVEVNIGSELDRLEESISNTDPTLSQNLLNRRKKVLYHIAAIRKKTFAAKLRQDVIAQSRLTNALASLLPHSALQERVLNVSEFLNKYGPNFLEWVYKATTVDERDHQLIYL